MKMGEIDGKTKQEKMQCIFNLVVAIATSLPSRKIRVVLPVLLCVGRTGEKASTCCTLWSMAAKKPITAVSPSARTTMKNGSDHIEVE